MLVRKKMEQEYKVEIIDVISYFQISNYDLKNVDIIISTIKLENQLKEEINIPAVEISPFFSANDQETLNNHNIIKKELRLYPNLNSIKTFLLCNTVFFLKSICSTTCCFSF